MGGIIDSIVDIITDVIDTVVDVIITIVDVVIDVVEAIVDVAADLLGFDSDSQTVEQFEVHNQSLFEDPDRTSIAEVVKNSVLRNEDIASNILFSEVFQSGKKNINQFVNHIANNNYFEDFPTVQANIMYVDYTEITSELNTIHGTPCTIEYATLGTLFVSTWIKYWLQQNKSYNVTANTIVYSSTTYTVDVYASSYNTATDDYTLQFSNSSGNIVPSYKAPSKPTNLHYIVNYHKDSVPLSTILFVYKVGSGTYTDLDDPTLEFGDAGSTALRILPAIPLRSNNVNFNTTTTTKSTQIIDTVKKLGLQADELIDAVMEDVADAGIVDYANKVDHVFLNFGVRIWDTSQIGINYLYRFMSVLYANQGTTEGIYNATPSTDEKPYNSIIVTASDYKYVFKFAYIKYKHSTLAEIDADASSLINAAYYSNLAKFTSGAPGNNDLINTYYVSSGNPGYNVGYKASNITQVNAYLAGTLTQESGYTPEAANWLQPTQRMSYSGTLINADDSTNTSGVLKPDNVYTQSTTVSTEQHDADSWGYAYAENFAPSDNIQGVTVASRRSGSACTYGYSFGITSDNSGIWVNHGCRATFNVEYNSAISENKNISDYSFVGTTSATNKSWSISQLESNLFDNNMTTYWSTLAYANGTWSGKPHITVDLGTAAVFTKFKFVPHAWHDYVSHNTQYETKLQYSDNNSSWTDTGDTASGTHSNGSYTYVYLNNTHTTAHRYWRFAIKTLTDSVYPSNQGYLRELSATYENNTLPSLQLVNRAEEVTTQGQNFTFYQCVINGLNAYTIQAPIAMLRVVDAATTKFKMVKFNISNQNDLMVPFSYDLVKNLPNSHVSSLFMASAHVSLYVAHYEVIEVPWWAKLLQIIQIVLIIISIVTFNPATFDFAIAIGEFAKKVLIQMLIKEIVVKIAEKISPELAMIVGAYLLWEYGGAKELDFSEFSDLAQLFGDISDIMSNVITVITEQDLGEIERDKTEALAIYNANIEDLAQIRKDLRLDYKGDPISLVNESVRGTIRTMSPVEYLAYYENFNQIGFMDYDYEQKINGVFEVPQYA